MLTKKNQAKKPLLLLEDSKHTILVAEDNPIYQKVVANQLSKLGYPCKVVENGRLALEELQSHPKEYSLVLLDLEMPVMNGFECADAIRHANDGVNNIPIVAFSTTKDDDFRKRTVDIGYVPKTTSCSQNWYSSFFRRFSEFLQKPATSADLDTTLKRWLTPVS